MSSLFTHPVNSPHHIYARNAGQQKTAKSGRRNTLQRVLPLLDICNPPERVEMWKQHRIKAGSFQIIAVHLKTVKCIFNHRSLVHLLAYDGTHTILDIAVKPRLEDGHIMELDNSKDLKYQQIQKGLDYSVAKQLFQQLIQTKKYAIIWAGMDVLQDVKTLGGEIPDMCCLLDLGHVFRYKNHPILIPRLKDLCEQILNVKLDGNYEDVIYALAKRVINHGDVCFLDEPFWFENVWYGNKPKSQQYYIKVSGLSDSSFKSEMEVVFQGLGLVEKFEYNSDGTANMMFTTSLPYETLLYSTMGFTFPDERSIHLDRVK